VNSTLREPSGWAPATAGASVGAHPGDAEPTRVYLRRFRSDARRPWDLRLVLGLTLLAALLFAKVWECTVANSLSMDRDRLRLDVRALSNRIQLSSEVRDRAVLLEQVDPRRLQAEGFVAPAPAQIIDIDLAQPTARAIPHEGVAARLGAWFRSVHPVRPSPGPNEAEAVPVRARIIP